MSRVWFFLHLLGFVLWMGGAFAVMVVGIAAKREDRSGLGAVVRAQAKVQRVLIAPGAIATVLSGLMLTFQIGATDITGANVWLILMQASGIVAALLVLFISLPTAVKLSHIDPTGPTADFFNELRQRQVLVGSIAGILGLAALLAGAMLRTGG